MGGEEKFTQCDGCPKDTCRVQHSGCDKRMSALEKNVEKLENNQGEMYGLIRDFMTKQATTEAKVDIITQTVNNMDKQLFAFLQQQNKNHANSEKDWKELIKYVIGATIGAVIMYLVKGGKL